VHNADSSSLFDDLDAALQCGPSENRVAVLRQVAALFPSEAGRLNEAEIDAFAGHERLKIDLAKLSRPTSGCFDFWPVREVSASSVQYRFFDFF
jgi:hypothetical protein